jgi:hypothetical protein
MRALHNPGTRADQVGAWRDGYRLAWERADAHGVIGLFTEDATCRPHPLRPCMPGHDGIRGVLGAGGHRPGQRPGPVRRAIVELAHPSSSSRSARQPPQGDAHGHARHWPSPARGRRGADLPSKGECAVPGRAPASHERGTGDGRRWWKTTLDGGGMAGNGAGRAAVDGPSRGGTPDEAAPTRRLPARRTRPPGAGPTGPRHPEPGAHDRRWS